MYNAIWILNVIAVLLLFAILVITIISMLKRNNRQKIEARAMVEAERHNKRNYMIISGLTEDYELLINDMVFDSVIPAVRDGRADVGVAGLSVTSEREEEVMFSDIYAITHQVVIVRK